MAAGKLRVAIVGFGFMGRTHYGAWKKTPCAKVTAICDSNLNQLSRKVAGNGNDADLATDFKGVAVVESFDELLARGGFDVVDLTLPTPLHPALVKKALAAGCHVLCEKPMALDVKSCDAMIAAAAKSRGKLMIAQCLRFAPAVKYLHDVVASEKYGKVVGASFDRASMLPGWGAGGKSWFLDEEASGGVLLDLHIHDVDFVLSLFGKPKSFYTVRASGGEKNSYVNTIMMYDDKAVSVEGTWDLPASHPFEATFRVVFEKAVVENAGGKFMCYTNDGTEEIVIEKKEIAGESFKGGNISDLGGYYNELVYFCDKAAKGEAVAEATVKDAVASLDFLLRELSFKG